MCLVLLIRIFSSGVLFVQLVSSTPMDTNQETPIQGASCAFSFTGNVGVPLMATLNLLGFTLGILVWLFSTPNVLNDPNVS